MRCVCGQEFEAKTSRRQFCSAKCRKLAWQRKREDELATLEEQLARAVRRLRALRGAAKDSP